MPTSVDTNVFILPDGSALSEGLEIAAGETDTPPDERRVRWIRTIDGALVADIQAYHDTFTNSDVVGMSAYEAETGDAPIDVFLASIAASGSAGASLVTRLGAVAADTGVYTRVLTGLVTPKTVQRWLTRMPNPSATQPESDYLQNARGPSQDNSRPNLSMAMGNNLGTFGAIAAGGTAQAALTGLPFNGKTPAFVVASMTTGGTIFFSNQYVIGTSNYVANGFTVLAGSGGLAAAAGWTAMISWTAGFIT